MDRELFRARLAAVAESVISFTQRFVVEDLPRQYLFLIKPNQSIDHGHKRHEAISVFPEDSLGKDVSLGPCNVDKAIEFLWRDGKVPTWINVGVDSLDKSYTYLKLDCSSEFTAEERFFSPPENGMQPFHRVGPFIPPWLSHIERSKIVRIPISQEDRFSLYWQKHYHAPLSVRVRGKVLYLQAYTAFAVRQLLVRIGIRRSRGRGIER